MSCMTLYKKSIKELVLTLVKVVILIMTSLSCGFSINIQTKKFKYKILDRTQINLSGPNEESFKQNNHC